MEPHNSAGNTVLKFPPGLYSYAVALCPGVSVGGMAVFRLGMPSSLPVGTPSRIPKATCTRTRVFSKTELFDPGYIETVTRIRADPELFENAQTPKRSFSKTLPKVDLSKTEVSDPDLCCV